MGLWCWILLILGWELSVITHELAHLIYAKANGCKIHSFRVWPSKVNGRWTAGSVEYYERKGFNRQAMCIVPVYSAIVLSAMWMALAVCWFPLFILGAWEWKNIAVFAWGFYGKVPGSDGGDFRELASLD